MNFQIRLGLFIAFWFVAGCQNTNFTPAAAPGPTAAAQPFPDPGCITDCSSQPAPFPSPSPSPAGPAANPYESLCVGTLSYLPSGLTAVANAINNVPSSSRTSQSVAYVLDFLNQGQGCTATLGNFVATFTSSSLTNASYPTGNPYFDDWDPPALGVNCGACPLALNGFSRKSDNSLTGVGGTTDICAPGSTLPCTKSSSGFIVEIQWSSSLGYTVFQIVGPDGSIASSSDLSIGDGVYHAVY